MRPAFALASVISAETPSVGAGFSPLRWYGRASRTSFFARWPGKSSLFSVCGVAGRGTVTL